MLAKYLTIAFRNLAKNKVYSLINVRIPVVYDGKALDYMKSAFVGKKVRVTGTVSTYNEALQIKIDKLAQIQVQPEPAALKP